ncbi:MAG: ATP-binding protein [Clostridia bacterium]|jgi:two-component system phosphate regulon sensor histidine kinase PhoR
MKTLRYNYIEKDDKTGIVIRNMQQGVLNVSLEESMKKRIYNSMLLLALITLFISALLFTGVVYGDFHRQMKNKVQNDAYLLSIGYDTGGKEYFLKAASQKDTGRITWVAADGAILYDSVSDPAKMDNHKNRTEVIKALQNGSGEALRRSHTLGVKNYYYALLLNDGTVLRISVNADSAMKTLSKFSLHGLLVLLPTILLTLFLAGKLSEKIITPINNLNLDNPMTNEVYDELSPLLTRIDKQNEQIRLQMETIKETQAEFYAIIDNIGEGIIILNHTGHVLTINKRAASILNVSPSDSINKHILSLSRDSTFQRVVERATEGQNSDDEFIKGDSTYRLLASPVQSENPVKGVLLFLMDVTEKRNAEKLRREFSANVSHELKTPLTAILGYAELLKNGLVQEKDIRDFSGRIYDEAKHMTSLIDDIIRISRLDEKNVKIPYEKVDLFKIAKDVTGRLTPAAVKKNVQMTVQGDRGTVYGVKRILDEVIYNLCDNAVKYNKENGKVDIIIKESEDYVTLTVQDTGIGIPEEHQNRVFERFYRVDKSRSRDAGGTGLGLAIVKHGVEFHNGTIKLKSVPGEGTTITIQLKRNDREEKKNE